MILEMSELAARKLDDARTRASSAISTCSSLLDTIHAIEQTHHYQFGVPTDLTTYLSQQQRLIPEMDYLAVLQLIDRSSKSRNSVLQTVNSFLSDEERRIAEVESESSHTNRNNIILPSEPDGCVPPILGAILGLIAWLAWDANGQNKFIMGVWIFAPIIGAWILPLLLRVAWIIWCEIIKLRTTVYVAARLKLATSARRSVKQARLTLAEVAQ